MSARILAGNSSCTTVLAQAPIGALQAWRFRCDARGCHLDEHSPASEHRCDSGARRDHHGRQAARAPLPACRREGWIETVRVSVDNPYQAVSSTDAETQGLDDEARSSPSRSLAHAPDDETGTTTSFAGRSSWQTDHRLTDLLVKSQSADGVLGRDSQSDKTLRTFACELAWQAFSMSP